MPRVKCKCGTERVIMAGKVKRCMKCDEKLTTLPVPAPTPEDDAIVGITEAEHLEAVQALDDEIGVLSAERTLAVAQIQEHEATIQALQLQVEDLNGKLVLALDELTTEQVCEAAQQLAAGLAKRVGQLTPKGQKWAIKLAKDAAGKIDELVIPASTAVAGKEGDSPAT
jgi:hypothetical protein